MTGAGSEDGLIRLALRLGAADVPGWSAAELRLARRARAASPAGGPAAGAAAARQAAAAIRAGGDPLGDTFCQLRSRERRRGAGQTLTPPAVVAAMTAWAAGQFPGAGPARVVDPGTGSARFLLAAGRRWPGALLAGVETDPLAAITGRANLAVAGLASRARITLTDYRSLRLPPVSGPTLFLGNPPYVRHHQIPARWKDWLRDTARSLGLPASGLAGLHAHFFLATALLARSGDAGTLVTAAEWLDVNYGSLVRALLLGPLGGQAVHLLDPAVPVFPDAAATSAITCFRPGSPPSAIRLRPVARAAGLGDLAGGHPVPGSVLGGTARWGALARALTAAGQAAAGQDPAGQAAAGQTVAGQDPAGADPVRRVLAAPDPAAQAGAGPATGGPCTRRGPGAARRGRLPDGRVELGELCRVRRGQVTGANQVWITAGRPPPVPRRFLFPAVTRARELFAAGTALTDGAALRLVIDLPADLGGLVEPERELVARFLAAAAARGAAGGYIARNRDPWWRVRLREPAPILATYMARRPPAFVRNLAGARHINIAHGLYPREPLPASVLDALAAHLRRSVRLDQGRIYAGGLAKFEPREMERIPVPTPDLL